MDRRASTGRRINISLQQSAFQDNTYLWDFVRTQAAEEAQDEAQDNDKTKGSKPQTEYAIFHAKYLNNNSSPNQLLELP
jgi:hypothetical protein